MLGNIIPVIRKPGESSAQAMDRTVKELMKMDIKEVLEERGKRYGDFPDHAKITQNIKRAMLNSPNWPTLSDDKKEALEMIAHKIGRILNGDPEYIDSWTDIIGYAKLVEDTLHLPNEFINNQTQKKEVSKYETIPTPQGQQSDKAQSLYPPVRPA